MNSKKMMNEIFRVNEFTSPAQAEDELNNSQSLVKRPSKPRPAPTSVSDFQKSLDGGSRSVRDEALDPGHWKTASNGELINELANLTEDLPEALRQSALSVIAELEKRIGSA
mgnify:CR=1 FL=1